MGYRLAMSAEIYDWLTELRGSDPRAALLTAEALAALADDGDRLGPPLVTVVDDRLPPQEQAADLDRRYQAQLESLTAMRRQVAQAAMRRKDLEHQLAQLEPPPDPAGLRDQLTAVAEEEERLTEDSQREQMRIDAFRVRKEVLKATHTAAEVERLIEQELNPAASAGGLMELRPAAPAGRSIRILFAVEPPGTALLIAAFEGRDAVRDHYREAVPLAAEVLREVRAGQAADAAAHTFDDARSFLAEFFPAPARTGRLHHVELWVPDLPRAAAEWGWLLTSLGYEQFQDWEAGRSWNLGGTYLVVEQSPAMTAADHDRLRPGLNHLAFHAGPRQQVDQLAAEAPAHGWTLLFPDRHPRAGGPDHYAAYLTSTDGYEVELVADDPESLS